MDLTPGSDSSAKGRKGRKAEEKRRKGVEKRGQHP
jgi:hypothetical protein